MSEIEFERCREEFVFDGSWRDLYIFDTTIDDWNAIAKILTTYKHEYFVDSDPDKLPTVFSPNFFVDRQYSCVLKTYFQSLQVNCHFFVVDEIELDIDPREIKDQGSFNELMALMRLMGERVDKDVVLTPENAEEIAILRYNARTRLLEYHPSPRQ